MAIIYKLPKRFAKKWVEFLRSGNYKQAHRAYSKGENCLCALGVGHVSQGCKPINLHVDGVDDWIMGDFSQDVPSYGPLYNQIVKLNDEDMKTLPEIADWIEQNVEFV